jgi:hypothetical protein
MRWRSAWSHGERIEIRGFGSFALNYRPPRVGRNPKSGEKVQVPEKYVPHFKAGKELRERVDYGTMSHGCSASGRHLRRQPLFCFGRCVCRSKRRDRHSFPHCSIFRTMTFL